jgi:hypothetical protein
MESAIVENIIQEGTTTAVVVTLVLVSVLRLQKQFYTQITPIFDRQTSSQKPLIKSASPSQEK